MQIGPRIRVGGTAGKIGEAIKHAVPSAGNMIGNAVAGAPGAVAGSLIHGGGKQLKRDIGVGARNAAVIVPAVGGAGAAAAAAKGALGRVGLGTVGSRAMDILKGGGSPGADGGMSLLDKLLLGGTVAAGAEDALHRRGLENDAKKYAVGSYDARAPLRERAMAMMQTDAPQSNYGAMFSDPGNVYDTQRRRVAPSVAQ